MRIYYAIFIILQINNKLKVIEPDSLKNQISYKGELGSVQYSESLFGEIPYTDKEELLLVLPQEDNQYGCNQLEAPQDTKQQFVYLVQQGECSFISKAVQGDKVQALAMLVIDSNPNEEINNVLPTPDTVYKKERIPIMLIDNAQGNLLLQAAKQGQVKLSFINDIDGKLSRQVNMELWINPSSLKSYKFLSKFKTILDQFGEKVNFQPKIKFHNLLNEPRQYNLQSRCYQNGLFCSLDQKDPLLFLEEGIRQICLFKLSFNNKQNLYWDYIEKYDQCLWDNSNQNNEVDGQCFKKIQDSLGWTQNFSQDIQNCIIKSFDNSMERYKSQNKLLQQDMNKFPYDQVYLAPVAFINGELAKEDLSVNVVSSAICSKLQKRPKICSEIMSNIKWRDNSNVTKLGLSEIFIFFVVLVILFLIVYLSIKLLAQNQLRKSVKESIDKHASDYQKIHTIS